MTSIFEQYSSIFGQKSYKNLITKKCKSLMINSLIIWHNHWNLYLKSSQKKNTRLYFREALSSVPLIFKKIIEYLKWPYYTNSYYSKYSFNAFKRRYCYNDCLVCAECEWFTFLNGWFSIVESSNSNLVESLRAE